MLLFQYYRINSVYLIIHGKFIKNKINKNVIIEFYKFKIKMFIINIIHENVIIKDYK